MRVIRAALVLAYFPASLLADGLKVRPSVTNYAVHEKTGKIDIGAELRYRAVPARGGTIFLRETLVVEVALFGPRGKRLEISTGHFSLRINGKGLPLMPQGPELVIYTDKYGSNPELTVGVNDSRVILGGPEPGPRFPGDTRSTTSRGPPRVEDPNRPAVKVEDPVERMRGAALPDGRQMLPVAGCLYFQYKKKMKSIKSLELLYHRPEGTLALKLK